MIICLSRAEHVGHDHSLLQQCFHGPSLTNGPVDHLVVCLMPEMMQNTALPPSRGISTLFPLSHALHSPAARPIHPFTLCTMKLAWPAAPRSSVAVRRHVACSLGEAPPLGRSVGPCPEFKLPLWRTKGAGGPWCVCYTFSI